MCLSALPPHDSAVLPPKLRELLRDATVATLTRGTVPFDVDEWWNHVNSIMHWDKTRFTPFGKLMSLQDLCGLLCHAPDEVALPDVALDYPPTDDILIGAGDPIATPKGWRFHTSALRQRLAAWRSVESRTEPRPSSIIQDGWSGQWAASVAPAYFNPVGSAPVEQEWDDEVSTLARMGAISPYTQTRLRLEGPPVVINPTFLTQGRRPIDDPILQARFAQSPARRFVSPLCCVHARH